jgi:hypothetical protein
VKCLKTSQWPIGALGAPTASSEVKVDTMSKSIELFASEVHDPETLDILVQAFDRAWSEIERRYVELPSLREETQRRLADCILRLVKEGIRGPERVKSSALVILVVEADAYSLRAFAARHTI